MHLRPYKNSCGARDKFWLNFEIYRTSCFAVIKSLGVILPWMGSYIGLKSNEKKDFTEQARSRELKSIFRAN